MASGRRRCGGCSPRPSPRPRGRPSRASWGTTSALRSRSALISGSKSQTFAPDLDNFTRVEVEYYNHRGSALYENARLLTMATVTGSTGPGSQPAASLRVDNGASSNGGATIVLMFDPDITRFRGFPTLNLQVRGYTGSVWSDVGAAQAFARDDDPHVTLAIASGTTIPRYLALQWSVSGSRDAFQDHGIA